MNQIVGKDKVIANDSHECKTGSSVDTRLTNNHQRKFKSSTHLSSGSEFEAENAHLIAAHKSNMFQQ